jgi:hypothetical protein
MASESPDKKLKTEETQEKDAEMADAAAPAEESKEEKTEQEPKEEEKKEPEPPKAPEPPKELEEDAPKTKDAAIKDTVAFLTPDTTINVLPSTVGNVLMSLTDGGFQYFLAGARANVGVKSGRYMFEAKIMELVDPIEDNRQSNGRRPQPKQLLKFGFSTAKSSLLLGDGEGSVFFDSEGGYVANKKTTRVCGRMGRDSVAAVVLNLDQSSPNANTVSLFLDGVRACQPQPLPDSLKGEVLFPTVSFRNVSVHTNFGPTPITPLPFTCKMVQEASTKDSQVKKVDAPKDGKYEVVFPVALPDEGGFDWLDAFLEKNPTHTELSDRSIIRWAEQSGIFRPKGYALSSLDKPTWDFGIPMIDDFSVRTLLKQVAPIQPRNFVVMELKGNLSKEDRIATLPLWNVSHFKTVAYVVMGEPPADFKKNVTTKLLQDKQDAADKIWRAKLMEEKRKKTVEQQQRRMERQRKKAEKERIKKVAQDKKRVEKEKRLA